MASLRNTITIIIIIQDENQQFNLDWLFLSHCTNTNVLKMECFPIFWLSSSVYEHPKFPHSLIQFNSYLYSTINPLGNKTLQLYLCCFTYLILQFCTTICVALLTWYTSCLVISYFFSIIFFLLVHNVVFRIINVIIIRNFSIWIRLILYAVMSSGLNYYTQVTESRHIRLAPRPLLVTCIVYTETYSTDCLTTASSLHTETYSMESSTTASYLHRIYRDILNRLHDHC